jgi:hypothetical protein
MNVVWKKLSPYLVHDFKRIGVDENVSKTRKNLVELVKKVGFDEVDLGDEEMLLHLHKE